MKGPLWKRLRDFPWERHGVSPAEAKAVQKLMQDLASHKEARAMRASQQLWGMLKSGSELSRAVQPFLEEVRQISAPSVRSEIDDLIAKC